MIGTPTIDMRFIFLIADLNLRQGKGKFVLLRPKPYDFIMTLVTKTLTHSPNSLLYLLHLTWFG